MAATASPLERGAPAPDFTLRGTDSRVWSRDELRGPNGLLVMFICNHCPYVLAVAAMASLRSARAPAGARGPDHRTDPDARHATPRRSSG